MEDHPKQFTYSGLDDTITKTLLSSTMDNTLKSNTIQRPRRIWEIYDFLLCPIIGTCLSLSEQKQILKKSGDLIKKMSEHDIHSLLVQLATKENRVSVRIEATLNRKYRKEMKAYFQISEKELLAAWETQFAIGEYLALLWTASVRPDLSEETVHVLFGDIHMQMHALSEQNRCDRRKLYRLEIENRKLSLQMKELKKTHREVLKANRLLKNERAVAQRKCTALEKKRLHLVRQRESEPSQHQVLTELRRENEALCRELEDLVESLQFLQKTQDDLKVENCSLRKQLSSTSRDELPDSVTTSVPGCPAEQKSAACNLCSCRVLVVGGLKKMEDLYRKTVERCGGIFEYHDGYVQGGKSALENKVRRADLVLCPVNCNSHGACLIAKRLGKKYGKMVRMLPGYSLSSISQSLWKYGKDNLHENYLTH